MAVEFGMVDGDHDSFTFLFVNEAAIQSNKFGVYDHYKIIASIFCASKNAYMFVYYPLLSNDFKSLLKVTVGFHST